MVHRGHGLRHERKRLTRNPGGPYISVLEVPGRTAG